MIIYLLMGKDNIRPILRRSLAVFTGLLFLILLELILRLFGAFPTNRTISSALTPYEPVYILEGNTYSRNADKKYFLSQEFSKKKQEDVTRIFITGGSTARGFPLDPVTTPAISISEGLESVLPDKNFEVINSAGFGIASYEVEEVVDEIVNYSPDIIIVMTGHNEFLERRFITKDAVGLSRAEKTFGNIRTYRLAQGLIKKAKGEIINEKQIPHIVTKMERELVVEDYRKTLEGISVKCKQRNVKLILVTCPSNIMNFRPYGPSQVSKDEQIFIDRGIKKNTKEKLKRSFQMLAEFERKYPDDAWVKYEKANAIRNISIFYSDMQNENLASSAQLFEESKDLDTKPVRAISEFNDIIHKTAAKHQFRVADLEKEYQKLRKSPAHMDSNYFFDHCHPNEIGHLLMCEKIIESVLKSLDDNPGENWKEKARLGIMTYLEITGSPKAYAEAYYRVAYETGTNMDRPYRGLVYSIKALEFYQDHKKAKKLYLQLKDITADQYELTGD